MCAARSIACPSLCTQPIIIHEGEKACEAAVAAGLPGLHTTTSGGASNAHLTDLSPCAGRHVLIVPDNDAPGRHYAEGVAARLKNVAESVRLVMLPHLPDHGDVVEWLAGGGTPEQFVALCQAAPPCNIPIATSPESNPTTSAPADDRGELDADIGDLAEITRRALEVLVSHNVPPKLFLHGGRPVRLETDEAGRPKPFELTVDRVRHELARAARWTRAKKGMTDRADARPPLDVAKNILATPDLQFPRLKAITEVPVVTRDGRMITQPGYDHHSGIYYEPFDPAVVIDVPDPPTPAHVIEAKALIDEMIGDFAFVGDADRAHAVALAIGMLCRDLIDGPTPLHDFEAPSPGTGKNLLVECLLHPAVGNNVGLVAEANDDDEWRKRLTARLREARSVLVLDNLSRSLDSGVISAVLTARQWDDRVLGKSETVSLPVRTMWALTANNPILSMEIARRTVRIRLDARTDRPWMRDGFRHENLRQWVEEHRADLIRALLVCIRAWLHAGRPAPAAKPLGSFESWSQVVGGIVEFAGYHDFLGNVVELYEIADSEGRAWRTLIGQWWQILSDRPVSTSELLVIAEPIEGIYLGKATSERGQKTSLGRQLKKRRDQIINGYRIEEAGAANHATSWRLRAVTSPAPPPSPCANNNPAHHEEVFEL